MSRAIRRGDRVICRSQLWRVEDATAAVAERTILMLRGIPCDGTPARDLSVVTPPEILAVAPHAELAFARDAFIAHPTWARLHEVLAATLTSDSGLLHGARFGRVQLEHWQLAPARRLLAKPRPSLLIADDVGLGKTIEAGLCLLELMARGHAGRVLVVAPPGLVLQWRAELLEKFGLDFTLIENASGLGAAQTGLAAGINPWDALPRIITSVDYLKKETVWRLALRKRWDVVVVDEAHALAVSGTPANPYETRRTKLGRALRDASRGLLLLTATPHNGYAHSFASLIDLVEPTLATFHGERSDVVRRIDAARIRRMKDQIRRRDEHGNEVPAFQRRRVFGIEVNSQPEELALLKKVASYCSKTAREAADEDDADLVSFAMQIVKKRALSSRRALRRTLEHRLEALKKEEQREAPPDRSELRDFQASLPMGDAAAERIARGVVRAAIPLEERRRKAEVKALGAIKKALDALPPRDPKVAALVGEITAVLAREPDERFIVFTEYLDTLEAIREALDAETALCNRYVVLRGGLSGRQRLRVQDAFEKETVRILLATDSASEGLNLQRACRRVVHFELPWNPNRLEQRNGRVDRYGQARAPEIRYLLFRGSAEEDVLDRLIQRIEQMRADQVSTPDVLGVLAGPVEIEQRLLELDPEDPELERRKSVVLARFEDRTKEFIRDVQPLVAATRGAEGDSGPSPSSEAADDGADLERLVRASLPTRAISAGPIEGTWRIETPVELRDAHVATLYPAATFRRVVAIRHRADVVDFVTPLHPLVRALAAVARRRLVQVWPDDRGLAPRRLAARAAQPGSAPSVVFTFLAAIHGGGGLLEERMIAVEIDGAGRRIGATADAACLREDDASRDVSFGLIERQFGARFLDLSRKAAEHAAAELLDLVKVVREQRREQVRILRESLERDRLDRLAQIDLEEKRSRGLVDEETGQGMLHFSGEPALRGFEKRRAIVDEQTGLRLEEIAAFEAVEAPDPPAPLGALLLVPETP